MFHPCLKMFHNWKWKFANISWKKKRDKIQTSTQQLTACQGRGKILWRHSVRPPAFQGKGLSWKYTKNLYKIIKATVWTEWHLFKQRITNRILSCFQHVRILIKMLKAISIIMTSLGWRTDNSSAETKIYSSTANLIQYSSWFHDSYFLNLIYVLKINWM